MIFAAGPMLTAIVPLSMVAAPLVARTLYVPARSILHCWFGAPKFASPAALVGMGLVVHVSAAPVAPVPGVIDSVTGAPATELPNWSRASTRGCVTNGVPPLLLADGCVR